MEDVLVGNGEVTLAVRKAEKDAFDWDDSRPDNEIDLYAPVNFADLREVLDRMFAVVERSVTGDDHAWYFFLSDWDRRFVLNLYDRQVTTGSCPVSEKQAKKAKVIVRKMMTPVSSRGRDD
jgi:hypothetical protein